MSVVAKVTLLRELIFILFVVLLTSTISFKRIIFPSFTRLIPLIEQSSISRVVSSNYPFKMSCVFGTDPSIIEEEEQVDSDYISRFKNVFKLYADPELAAFRLKNSHVAIIGLVILYTMIVL